MEIKLTLLVVISAEITEVAAVPYDFLARAQLLCDPKAVYSVTMDLTNMTSLVALQTVGVHISLYPK